MADKVVVEVVYALPDQQRLVVVDVPQGASVAAAVAASGLVEAFGFDPESLDVGVWSRRVRADARVCEGDRIEIYRPLKVDPKQARRQRAAANPRPRRR